MYETVLSGINCCILLKAGLELKLTEQIILRWNKLGGSYPFHFGREYRLFKWDRSFCAHKYDVENSYNQPDRINKIDWERKLQYPDVVEYYKDWFNCESTSHVRLRTREAIEQNLKFSMTIWVIVFHTIAWLFKWSFRKIHGSKRLSCSSPIHTMFYSASG